jgi:hypothetical protein
MKIRSIVGSAMLVAVTALITTQVVSQDAKSPPAMTPEEQAMMEKWMAFATPGEAHKVLERKVGSWSAVVRFWQNPNAPPSESTGTSEMHMIMDGRYLVDEMEGQTEWGPFHGMGCTGYDNLKKKYVAAWIDNMGTGIMLAEGTYDPATKTFTYWGESPDPEAGKYKKTKTIERTISDDKWVMEMWDKTPDGKDFKAMEIAYTRVK